MEWPQQFEIIHKIFSNFLLEQGKRPSLTNIAKYIGIPLHKYQAWKDGQKPVTDDLYRLAREFEFRPEWLLLGVGEPLERRLDRPFDPKFVDICDTLHDLAKQLPDPLPKIAEVGGMTTTQLYDCMGSQAYPPAEAVAKWVIHYKINANFLLAQIGKPFLTEEQYQERGPLSYVRERRGDFAELPGDESEEAAAWRIAIELLQKELAEAKDEIREHAREVTALSAENRSLRQRLEAAQEPAQPKEKETAHAAGQE